jgi:hypothetical protein
MSAYDRALAHCARLDAEDRQLYMLGFNAGRAVTTPLPGLTVDDDRESYFRSLLEVGDSAAAAGFLEGVAATRPLVPQAQPPRRKAVAA